MPDLHIRVGKELLIRLKLLAEKSNMSLHDFVKTHLERLAHQDSHIKPSTSGLAHKVEHINSSTSEQAHENKHIKSSTSERVADPPEGKRVDVDEFVQKVVDLLEKRLSRKIQDQLNPFTSKIDQIAQKQAEFAERLESLEERVKKLEEAVQSSARASEEKQRVSEKSAKREKVDKCENLKKEFVLFESEIYGKIRNRDKFFASLERDCGAVIIEGAKERIAVEKAFWQQFLDKLSKIDTSDEERIKSVLDSLEFRLFTALKESVLLVYHASERKWRPAISITAKPSTATPAFSTGKSTESSTKKHYKKHYEEEDESWLLQYAPEPEEE